MIKMNRVNVLLSLLLAVVLTATGCSLPAADQLAASDAAGSVRTEAPQWEAGKSYVAGDKVTYYSEDYECLMPHTAAGSNWDPINAPSLWARVYPGEESGIARSWHPGGHYDKGTVILYFENGKYYKALKAHTALDGWAPDTTPSLYEEINVVVKDPGVLEAKVPEMTEYYEAWKNRYTIETSFFQELPAPYVSGPRHDYTFVYYNGPSAWMGANGINPDWYSAIDQDSNPEYAKRVTVSEAHGYGMLSAVQMNDRYAFGKFFAFFKKFTNEYGNMAWAIKVKDDFNSTGQTITPYPEGDPSPYRPYNTMSVENLEAESWGSATDGDIDIAYALILAYRKWGAEQYKDSAQRLLDAIRTTSIHGTYYHIKLGDWVPDGAYFRESPVLWQNFDYSLATRSSDFCLDNLLTFAEFDTANSALWTKVYEATVKAINEAADPVTGILSDFTYYNPATGKYEPIPHPEDAKALGYTDAEWWSPNYTFLEGTHDGDYYYNACRTPWRISVSQIQDPNNKDVDAVIQRWNSWIQGPDAANGQAWNIKAGYKLDGTPINSWGGTPFTSPFMVLARAAGDDAWFESLWAHQFTWVSEWDKMGGYYGDVHYTDYFGDTIRLMSALVATGHNN